MRWGVSKFRVCRLVVGVLMVIHPAAAAAATVATAAAAATTTTTTTTGTGRPLPTNYVPLGCQEPKSKKVMVERASPTQTDSYSYSYSYSYYYYYYY